MIWYCHCLCVTSRYCSDIIIAADVLDCYSLFVVTTAPVWRWVTLRHSARLRIPHSSPLTVTGPVSVVAPTRKLINFFTNYFFWKYLLDKYKYVFFIIRHLNLQIWQWLTHKSIKQFIKKSCCFYIFRNKMNHVKLEKMTHFLV